MFPLTEARGGGNGGMSKDGIRKWEDLATEDRVAGCPGYVSQKVSLHQIFLWFHFLSSRLTLESLFSSYGKQGLLFVAVHRLLIAVASLVAEHRL